MKSVKFREEEKNYSVKNRKVKKLKKIKRKSLTKKIHKKLKRIKENWEQDLIDNSDYEKMLLDYKNSEEEQKLEFTWYNTPKTKEEHKKYLDDLIEDSEMLLEIVDSRNINNTRINKSIEDKIISKNKFLILVLNKSDLVSPLFLTQQYDELKKVNYVLSCTTCVRENFEKFFEHLNQYVDLYLKKNKNKKGVKIGIIGYPNMGKNSILNCFKLINDADCYDKIIYYDDNKKLGINSIIATIYEESDDNNFLFSKCEKDINEIKNPKKLIENITKYINKKVFENYYHITFRGTFDNFCSKISEKFSLIEIEDAYKIIIRDIACGKIGFEISI